MEGNENDIQYFHKNYLDHVYAVSDENGNLLEHYRYTAFGEPEVYSSVGIKLPSSAIDNDILWNVKRYDEVSGLYMYLYRHYEAEHGRWTSRDPIEEEGGVNLYGFVGNNSSNLVDFLGLERLTLNYDFDHKKAPSGVVKVNSFSDILKHAKSKIRKWSFWGRGECDCIERLRIGGHGAKGSATFLPSGDDDAELKPDTIFSYLSVRNYNNFKKKGKEMDDFWRKQLQTEINLDAIDSLMCQNGKVTFIACYLCGGEEGGALIDELETIFGEGNVYGYTGLVNWFRPNFQLMLSGRVIGGEK